MIKNSILTIAVLSLGVSARRRLDQLARPELQRCHQRQEPAREVFKTENIAWQIELPGPGAGTPIIVGDRVF